MKLKSVGDHRGTKTLGLISLLAFASLAMGRVQAQQECTAEVPLFSTLSLGITTNVGTAYSIDFEGIYAAMGIPEDGEVHVFRRSSTTTNDWAYVHTVGNGQEDFGLKVELEGGQMFVSSPSQNSDSGRFFIYSSIGPSTAPMVLQQTFSRNGSSPGGEARFSEGFDVDGTRLLIGSPYTEDEDTVGLLYTYAFDGVRWNYQRFAQAPTASNQDFYGRQVEMETDTALVNSAAGTFRLTFASGTGTWVLSALYPYPDASFDLGPNWFMISRSTGMDVYNNTLNGGSNWTLFETITTQVGVNFANQEVEVGAGYALVKTDPVSILRAPPGGGSSWLFDRTISTNPPPVNLSGTLATVQVDDENYRVYNVGLVVPELLPIADQALIINQPMTPVEIVACSSSGINNIEITPPLPEGLSLDFNTRLISGTPTVAQSPTTYTVAVTVNSEVVEAQVVIQIFHAAQSFPGGNAQGMLGAATAISGDTALAGAPSDTDGNGNGEVSFYRATGGTWAADGSFSNPTASGNGRFGASVAVSQDLALVSGSRDGSNRGVAMVYERSGGGNPWVYQSSISASDGTANNAFGFALALDDTHLYAGAPGAGSSAGAVYIYRRNAVNAALWDQVAKLTPTGASVGDRFGASVALDADLLAVGAPANAGGGGESGAVYIFRRSAGTPDVWNQIQVLRLPASGADQEFGYALDLQDGLLIASTRANPPTSANVNRVAIFSATGPANAPFVVEQMLMQNPADGALEYGARVQINDAYALVSAPASDAGINQPGRVYVYAHHLYGENAWTQASFYQAVPAAVNDQFGLGLGLAVTSVIVGAPGADAVAGVQSEDGRVDFFDDGLPPAYFRYTDNPASYEFGNTITPNTVIFTSGAALTNFVISPALPTGLQLDANTGTISGTPGAPLSSTVFEVVAQSGVFFQTNTVTIEVTGNGFDFGDAPDQPPAGFSGAYATKLAQDGARHVAVGPRFGPNRDIEPDGIPNSVALGDDVLGGDDEDGVILPQGIPLGVSNPATVQIEIDLQNPDPSSNRLDAWIDWSHDGVFAANEKIFDNFDLGLTSGVRTVTFQVPPSSDSNVNEGQTFARFRLSTVGGLVSTGVANDGEVEDYTIELTFGPQAGDDRFAREFGQQISIPISVILANDQPVDPNNSLFLSSVEAPESGQAFNYATSTDVVYVPNNGYHLGDRFVYNIIELGGSGGSGSGEIKIDVQPSGQTVVQMGDNEYRVEFAGDRQEQYEVEFTEGLLPPNWQALSQTQSNSNGVFSVTHTNELDRVYYRARLVIP